VPTANSLHTTAYTPEDGPCETVTCRAILEEEHEMGVVEPGTARKAALKTVFVHAYPHSYVLVCIKTLHPECPSSIFHAYNKFINKLSIF
jgi:hypothetical protein